MRTKNIIILSFLFLIIMADVKAYTPALSDNSVLPGETLVLSLTTDSFFERRKSYTVEWNNGTVIKETDTGKLSSLTGGTVFETYITPLNVNWTSSYVTITVGADVQTLYFNVTGNNVNSLIIDNVNFATDARIGSLFSLDFQVSDINGNKLSNAECSVYGTDITEAPKQRCGQKIVSYHGRGICDGIIEETATFLEEEEYISKVRCNCGSGEKACFNEAGQSINRSSGENNFVFKINPWLKVNTITDKSKYTLDDKEVLVCANITNNLTYRLPIEITYNIRCNSNDSATDRVIISSHNELRGISGLTTQNQCASLDIVNIRSIQNKVNNCYAATDVTVYGLDGLTRKVNYPTTSPSFNITSESSILSEEANNEMEWNIVFGIGLLIALFIIFTVALRREHPYLTNFFFIGTFIFMTVETNILWRIAHDAGSVLEPTMLIVYRIMLIITMTMMLIILVLLTKEAVQIRRINGNPVDGIRGSLKMNDNLGK